MVTERAGVAVAEMTMLDKARSLSVADNAEVIATEAGTRIFAGYVREVNPVALGRTRLYRITCQDYNVLLDEDAIVAPASRTVTESDRARVMWLFTTHGTKGITANTYVQTVLATLPLGVDGTAEQDFGAKTFREALDYIARIAGARYHIDFNKELHWYPAAGEGLAAPSHLSTTPNNTTTFMAMDVEAPRTVADYRDAVFVRGHGTVYGWWPNPPPAAATRRAGVLRDDEITSTAQLEAAGAAYLAEHAIEDNATVATLKAGLRTGMAVQLTSPVHGFTAKVFAVREIVTTLINKTTPLFRLSLGMEPVTLGGIIGGASDTAQQAIEVLTQVVSGGEAVIDLQVGGANLLPNSSFENKTTNGWTVGSQWAWALEIGSAAQAGTKTARFAVTAVTVGNLDSPRVAVAPTADYWLSAWTYIRSRTAGTFIVEALEYNAALTLLATTTLRSVSVADSAWVRSTKRFGPNTSYGRTQFQATTASLQLRIRASGTATMTADVDAVQLERGTLLSAYAPSPYELMDQSVTEVSIASGAIIETKISDSAITTPKLGALAVTADKIATNAIVAGKIAAGIITSLHISAEGINAGKITSGELHLGGIAGVPDVLVVYDAAGDEIGRWGETGLLITDANNPLLMLRLQNGVLAFSTDGGVIWTTAISGEGISADAIRFGTFPGGSNRIPNSGFELASFQTPLTKVWTVTADWAATIGTDVNVTKTGSSLVMTTTTY